jgi:hypothetical protein
MSRTSAQSRLRRKPGRRVKSKIKGKTMTKNKKITKTTEDKYKETPSRDVKFYSINSTSTQNSMICLREKSRD